MAQRAQQRLPFRRLQPAGGPGRHLAAVAHDGLVPVLRRFGGIEPDHPAVVPARAGDAAVIGGPRGSIVIADDLPWHLLAGDATALPAIARRLDELPAGTPTTVLLHTPHEQDQQALPERPGLTLRWLPSGEALCDAMRTVDLPAGDGFVWCAGEAACMARLRDILLNERGRPRSHVKVSAYWKPGASDFHQDLA